MRRVLLPRRGKGYQLLRRLARIQDGSVRHQRGRAGSPMERGSAVNRGGNAQAARELGLELAPVEKTSDERLGIGLPAGELVEQLPVPALRGAEIGKKARDLRILDDLQKP